MTTYKKIVTIRFTDEKKPHRDFEIYQRQIGGIDAVLLNMSPGIQEATYKFICSDNDPETPRTIEDIDRLLSNSKIKILREMSSHPDDPVESGRAKQSLLIETNLDNPNISDKFISKATNVRTVSVTKENLKSQNEKIERENKQSGKSQSDPSKLKLFDEKKTTVHVGQVEKE